MKIVVDTNVLISAIFFGGKPRRIIEAIADGALNAYATPAIVAEYLEVLDEMLRRKQGNLDSSMLMPLLKKMIVIQPVSSIKLSRDPDDDKFIECAVDARAMFIVSGDKDLLDVAEYRSIRIVSVHEFCQEYLD